MTFERGQKGLARMGDEDLARQLGEIHEEFARRHTGIGMTDIPLEGDLPQRFVGDPSRIHPSLEALEDKVLYETTIIGGITSLGLLAEFTGSGQGVPINSFVRGMIENPDFTTLPEPTRIDLARVHVKDLAIPTMPNKDYPTISDIYRKIDDLGLEPLPAEAAFHYLLQNGGQLQRNEMLIMGMKPMLIDYYHSPGNPQHLVFVLGHNAGGLWLDGLPWGHPDHQVNPGKEFVFGLRK